MSVKRPYDENAYDFLYGFFSGIKNLTYNLQALYNNIDGKGSMVWGPVTKVMNTQVLNNSTITKAFWVQMHEVEHVFQEGGDLLVAKKVIDIAALSQVRTRFACIKESLMTEDSLKFVNFAAKSFKDNNAFMVGHFLVMAAAKMCQAENLLFLQ